MRDYQGEKMKKPIVSFGTIVLFVFVFAITAHAGPYQIGGNRYVKKSEYWNYVDHDLKDLAKARCQKGLNDGVVRSWVLSGTRGSQFIGSKIVCKSMKEDGTLSSVFFNEELFGNAHQGLTTQSKIPLSHLPVGVDLKWVKSFFQNAEDSEQILGDVRLLSLPASAILNESQQAQPAGWATNRVHGKMERLQCEEGSVLTRIDVKYIDSNAGSTIGPVKIQCEELNKVSSSLVKAY